MIQAEKLKTYDEKKFKPGYASVKRNGIHAIYDPGTGHIFYSRTPKEIKGLDHLVLEANSTNVNFPLVGELTIPGEDFETASGEIRSDNPTPDAVFTVFNCIMPGLSFAQRYANLVSLEERYLSESSCLFIEEMFLVENLQSFNRFYEKNIEAGEEGVCWISPDHIYQPGKRTWDWMKRIPMKSIEVKVIKLHPGTKGKKYEHSLGALECEMANGNRVKVGIFKGQTDEWRQRIYDQRHSKDTIKGKWITIEFKDYSKYGIPTQARYKAVRWDL